jgi:hypothetical protein
MDAVVKVYGDRPTTLEVDGWRISVSTHDHYYIETRRKYRRLLKQCHPDMGGSATAFRRARMAYGRWVRLEQNWYNNHGLTPPKVGME